MKVVKKNWPARALICTDLRPRVGTITSGNVPNVKCRACRLQAYSFVDLCVNIADRL